MARAAEPLSFAQQLLWLHDQLVPGNPAYHMSRAWRLRGPLDMRLLREALSQVVARHEPLRSTVRASGDDVWQEVHPAPPVDLPVHDLTGAPDSERVDTAVRLAIAEAARRFDLARGPLYRCGIYRLGEQDHLLLIALHHIVADGWSLDLLWRELEIFYQAWLRGEAPAPPDLPLRYAEYARWQRDRLAGAAERDLEYWRDQLASAPDLLRLPTDHPRPPEQGFAGAKVKRLLPGPVAGRLEKLAAAARTTLFMALISGVGAVLHRYTGDDDLVIGVPVAGRDHPDSERLIGFFVNTLPLRLRLGGDPTFAELLARIRQACTDLYEHAELPLWHVLELLRPARSLGHSPLFQVTVGYLPQYRSDWWLGQLHVTQQDLDIGYTPYDLNLELARVEAGLQCTATYRTDLFAPRTIEGLLDALVVALSAGAARPDTPVSALPLLDPDTSPVTRFAADPDPPAPPACSIPDLIARYAAAQPDRPAVRFDGAELDYAGLDRRASELAARLRARGVGRESVVATYLSRSIDLVPCLLGILKAGGAYLALDPHSPPARLSTIVNGSGARLVLADADATGSLPATEAPIITLDQLLAGPGAPVDTVPDPGDVAYVGYTSGSTGEPKGIEVTHQNVVHLVHRPRYIDLTPDDVVFGYAPLSFDASTFEIWGTLATGGCLALAPAYQLSTAEIHAIVARESVTVLWLTTPLFHLVADATPADLAGVRLILTGGEVLSPQHAERVLRALPNCRLINCYGPTETTTFATAYPVDRELRYFGGSVPIGRPVNGTRIYVLDHARRPVPPGVAGEIYIGGPGVARGYRGRPDYTKERFLGDPAVPGGRMFRTGDLGRFLPDGNLEFLGRLDKQVKIRGFRIEPGEVEAVLQSHPGVRESLVTAVADATGGKQLVARVTSTHNPPITAGQLRGFLRERLPGYMVPDEISVVDALAVTAGGKLDRAPAAHPAGSTQLSGGDAAHQQRLTEPVFATVLGLYQDVLGVDGLRPHDDFFEFGGNSLLAVRLVARLRSALGVDVTLREAIANPTPATMTALVELRYRQGRGVGMPPLRRQDRQSDLPVSVLQENQLLRDARAREQGRPNDPRIITMVWHADGPLDAATVQEALNEMVRRHEAFRVRFTVDGAGVRQHLMPPRPVSLDVIDADTDDAVADLVAQERGTAFDLGGDILLRGTLLGCRAGRHTLVLSTDHMVFDGWSADVLLDDFVTVYRALREGAPLPPGPAVQQADCIAWQIDRLTGPIGERLLDYWRRQLAGTGPFPPLDLPGAEAEPRSVDRRVVELAAAEYTALIRHAVGQGLNLFTVLLGAVQFGVGAALSLDDVVVHSPIANRDLVEMEDVIGWFSASVVFRARLDPLRSVPDYLAEVRASTLDAYAHHVPLPHLVKALQPVEFGAGRRMRPPRVYFSLVDSTVSAARTASLCGTTLSTAPPPTPARPQPGVSFYAETHPGGLRLSVMAWRRHGDQDVFQRMAEATQAFLRAVASGSEQALGELSAPHAMHDLRAKR